MRNVILSLAAVAALVVTDSATAQTPKLSFSRAKVALLANARLDHPTSVTLAGCRRLSRSAISCMVIEYGAHTLILDNGQPIVGTLSWRHSATLERARIVVS